MTVHRDLIYDVGMHRGEDTAYYLAKGYRVVGFEANPALVEHCRRRFADEIANGRLEIVDGAIGDHPGPTATFFVHASNSVFGTTRPDWAERNLSWGPSQAIEVRVVDFSATLERTGMPHYLKIDIEGADRACLDVVAAMSEVPRYISMESTLAGFAEVRSELDALATLGFNSFAVVQQATLPGHAINTERLDGTPMRWTYEEHASGGFGTDIRDWMGYDDALAKYRRIMRWHRAFEPRIAKKLRGGIQRVRNIPMPGWHDTHARRVD